MVGCAVDAQWMRSGCTAGRSVTTAVVEAKKDRCAYDAAPKFPQDSADAPRHHLHLREFCLKLERNRGNRPNFAPVAFLVGTNNPGDPPPNIRRFALPILTSDQDGFRRRQSVASSCSCCPPPEVAKQRRDRPPSQR
jgi:hypothetical protein